ncbi:hypothetical protein VTK26DRAFT_9342 [Humicola hyalothermophila]
MHRNEGTWNHMWQGTPSYCSRQVVDQSAGENVKRPATAAFLEALVLPKIGRICYRNIDAAPADTRAVIFTAVLGDGRGGAGSRHIS